MKRQKWILDIYVTVSFLGCDCEGLGEVKVVRLAAFKIGQVGKAFGECVCESVLKNINLLFYSSFYAGFSFKEQFLL